MQRYDSYKDSGVKWLGEIPEHWEVKRLASYFTERRVKVSDKDFEPLSVTKLGVFPQWENVAKTNDGDNRKLVKKGDFVINSRSDRKGSSGISDRDGSVSLINIVLQPRKTILAQFSNYLLKSYRFIEEYYRNGRGIVADLWTTRYDEMKMIKLAIPPLKEQEAIANYLDTATAKIDSAIAQQQKMIDLLNERKQIIINRAVTKGLNPNAKMKDSGVEWIGEVPEGWEVMRMKYCMKIKNGMDYKHVQTESGIPVIGSGGQFAYASNYMYDGEVVFFGRKGTVDRPLYLKGKFWAVDTMFYTIPNSKILGKYLYYQGLTIPYKYYSTSTALPSMTQTDLGNNPICLPSIIEQKEIVDYLDYICEKLDFVIANCNRQISLLQERKQIIINEVVTGKVKVG